MGARLASVGKPGGKDPGEAGLMFLRGAVGAGEGGPGARLVLARRLLEAGREAEATGHLEALAAGGVAEAAFFLGVCATPRGDFCGALAQMERALALNPEHAPTREQVEKLREIRKERRQPE